MAAQVFLDRGLCLLTNKTGSGWYNQRFKPLIIPTYTTIFTLCFKNNHITKEINYVEPKNIT
ncbi:hypothetical protein [Microcoleus sp. Pol17C2]|uniref:hypothetical protein n=1 Tax=Microcoleus sp. Pol17C2 TaxID=3055403 RepID=UPI002FD1716B